MATPDQMRNAADRRARLLDLIAATKAPTARGLAPQLGVSFKTAQLDLHVLRDAGLVEWDTDPSGRIRQGTIRLARH